MRSVFASRGAICEGVRPVFGLALALAVVLGCSVNDSGLATSVILQSPDGGFGGGSGGAGATGSGGATGTGGAITTGGATGSGGSVPTGGSTGSGGTTSAGGSTGTGGDSATGGTTGTGGKKATGGAIGTGGMTASGGTSGTGGMTATGGMTGTGGTTGLGGTTGTGGATGTGGSGTTCGPGNCTGCCANGQCVKTTNAQQCGSNGGACTPCGGCETCSAGACAINPSSQWTIVAQSATIAMTPPGGGTWNPPNRKVGGSAPDLFCQYENPAFDVSTTTAGITSTVIGVYTANWDQTITPAGVTVSAMALMASKPAWRIWVGSADCVSPTNCGTVGEVACSYQLPMTAADLEAGALAFSNYQSCISVQLQLVCQSPAGP